MWLLPTGYNFLLQAGSIGNDTFPTIYALAAVDFGLRAWDSRRLSDLRLSILSASLLTGTKATNLPLLLPWGILVLPLLPWLFCRPVFGGARTSLSASTGGLAQTTSVDKQHDWCKRTPTHPEAVVLLTRLAGGDHRPLVR
jgi:hypothetical protein